MKMIQLVCAALLIVILAGCQTVPATEVRFKPKTGEFEIKSPKDIGITNLVATVTNGVPTLSVGSYSSRNSPDVISAVAEANAQMAKILGQLVLQLAEQAAKGAVPVSTPIQQIHSVPVSSQNYTITPITAQQ